MSRACAISAVKLTDSTPVEQESGLLGWVECTLNEGLRLDGLALRRTREGKHGVSYPARRDGQGTHRYYVRPLNERVHKQIERQVLAELRRQGRLGS